MSDDLEPLEIRVGTKRAAKLLGVSVRQVQEFVADGLIAAVDMRGARATRPLWSIAMSSLRAFITSRDPAQEAQGAQRPHAK